MAVFKKTKDQPEQKESNQIIAKKPAKGIDLSLDLSPNPGSNKSKKRLGRGIGSGLGKTSGRGQKGQGSRSGGGVKPGFEGGQMPLQRRVPKRGFVNVTKTQYNEISLKILLQMGELPNLIDKNSLGQMGLIKLKDCGIKIIGAAPLEKGFEVVVNRISQKAREIIEKSGGKVTLLPDKPKIIKGTKKNQENKLPRRMKKYQKPSAQLDKLV